MAAWFAPYVDQGLHLASWGFAVEAGTHALRLIYSGLFDRHPNLQMILGHLGEMLPFTAFRTDRYYGLGGSGGRLQKLPSEYLRENFHFTTSGNFSPPAMACTLAVMGADRVMFSVDYPWTTTSTGRISWRRTRWTRRTAARSVMGMRCGSSGIAFRGSGCGDQSRGRASQLRLTDLLTWLSWSMASSMRRRGTATRHSGIRPVNRSVSGLKSTAVGVSSRGSFGS